MRTTAIELGRDGSRTVTPSKTPTRSKAGAKAGANAHVIARAALQRSVRATILLRHSLAADAELAERLPQILEAFDATVLAGRPFEYNVGELLEPTTTKAVANRSTTSSRAVKSGRRTKRRSRLRYPLVRLRMPPGRVDWLGLMLSVPNSHRLAVSRFTEDAPRHPVP
jgi:hypothetical protein